MLAWITGDPMWDAVGTLAIGAVLIGVAVFLAVEVKSLLLGEAADSVLTRRIEELVRADDNVEDVLQTITVQRGPGEILVALKIHFDSALSVDRTVHAINAIEVALRREMPELRWILIEPDHPPGAGVVEPDRKVE